MKIKEQVKYDISWGIRSIIAMSFIVFLAISPTLSSKIAPILEKVNPLALTSILFLLIVLVSTLVGTVAAKTILIKDVSDSVAEAKLLVENFSKKADGVESQLDSFNVLFASSRIQAKEIIGELKKISENFHISLNMHHQIIKDQLGALLINYEEMAKIEADVPDADEIWILTSALELEEEEFDNIIRGNLARGVKYTYLIPKNNGLLRGKMQKLASGWQQHCQLNQVAASERIKCILIPDHFAYMTVVVYSPYGKPVVLVKFPTSPMFSEVRYPLIYRVADQPKEATNVFVRALQDLIADHSQCKGRMPIELKFS